MPARRRRATARRARRAASSAAAAAALCLRALAGGGCGPPALTHRSRPLAGHGDAPNCARRPPGGLARGAAAVCGHCICNMLSK